MNDDTSTHEEIAQEVGAGRTAITMRLARTLQKLVTIFGTRGNPIRGERSEPLHRNKHEKSRPPQAGGTGTEYKPRVFGIM